MENISVENSEVYSVEKRDRSEDSLIKNKDDKIQNIDENKEGGVLIANNPTKNTAVRKRKNFVIRMAENLGNYMIRDDLELKKSDINLAQLLQIAPYSEI
ncbi:hypothetical protein AYI68_g5105 [Smittium mucronatum]|uniref:Uncharacterized protein n=1 Tax=Smittium mucronatum TaxID=133383 RepID=A0A1R0GV74_9FUNG|nr:hypothetical protein AYI68_g5105 [Smittium mucronatum]